LHFGGSIFDLSFESFRAHHGLLQIGAIDGEGQVGLVGLEALDVGEPGILQLDDKLFAVVRRVLIPIIAIKVAKVAKRFGGVRLGRRDRRTFSSLG
jgi:hypothetical protein